MRLKELRIKKNLRQEDVAQMLGVERSTYTKYESGASKPKNETLVELSNFYNVSVDYILEITDKKEKPTPVAGDGLSALEWDLISIFRRIPPDEQERVIRIVQAASDSLRQLPEQLE